MMIFYLTHAIGPIGAVNYILCICYYLMRRECDFNYHLPTLIFCVPKKSKTKRTWTKNELIRKSIMLPQSMAVSNGAYICPILAQAHIPYIKLYWRWMRSKVISQKIDLTLVIDPIAITDAILCVIYY